METALIKSARDFDVTRDALRAIIHYIASGQCLPTIDDIYKNETDNNENPDAHGRRRGAMNTNCEYVSDDIRDDVNKSLEHVEIGVRRLFFVVPHARAA